MRASNPLGTRNIFPYKSVEWSSEEVYLSADAAGVRFSSLHAPLFRPLRKERGKSGDAELAL
jgi:hypothetical protein